MVVQGFIDNHTHFTSGGFQLQSIDLRHAQTEEKFAGLIREWAERNPGRWIIDGTWDHDNFPGGNLPTRQLIDPYTPETPVFYTALQRSHGQTKSYTPRMAGITRVYAILPFSRWEHLAEAGIQAPFGNHFVRIGDLKAMADRSLGSSAALFFEPYTSDPATHGLPSDVLDDGLLEAWVMAADKAGLQPVNHAIDDSRWAEARIGHERGKNTYAFRSFLDAGAIMSFGSDWIVAPLNPLLTIYAAVDYTGQAGGSGDAVSQHPQDRSGRD